MSLSKVSDFVISIAFLMLLIPIEAQNVSYDQVDWLESGIIVQRKDDVLVYDHELQLVGGLYNLGLIWKMLPSPDSHYVALLINDKTPSAASIQIWDLVQKTLVFTVSDVNSNAFAWSTDSRLLAVDYQTGAYSADNQLSIYSVTENAIVQSFLRPDEQGAAFKIVWTANNYLGELNENFDVWHVDAVSPYRVSFVGSYTLGTAYPSDVIVNDIVASSAKPQFAVASENLALDTYRIEIIDASTLEINKTLPVHHSVVRLDWLTNGFFGYFRDSKLAFVDAETGVLISSFNPEPFTSLFGYKANADGTKVLVINKQGFGIIYSSTGEVLYTRDIAADAEAIDLTPVPTSR